MHPALGTRACNADAAVDPAALQEANHHQQDMVQHHAAPRQDWQQQQQQRLDSPAHSQQGALNSPAYITHKAQHTGQPSLQLQEPQQDSKQQQPFLHRQLQQQDSFASDRTAQLPPRLRPALSSRGRADSDPTSAMQHHSHASSSIKKKVTWADEGGPGVGASTATAAGHASSATQEAALWQDLLLLQQLQQVSALSVSQLQLLVQKLTALDSTASSSGRAVCLWSGQAGSCAGGHCFNNHIPSQPSAHYQQRAALMQRCDIRPGAAGQYHVQLQHVQTMLAAVQGHAQAPPLPAQQQPPQQQPAPPLPQKQEQEAQHRDVLHWPDVADERDQLSAFEPACSDTSAHTCDSAPRMAADSGTFGGDADAQGCFSFAAATPEQAPAGAAPSAACCKPASADAQRGQDHVSSASAAPEVPDIAPSTAGSGALASAGCVLRVLANSHGASAPQEAGLAEPGRSSWPLPTPRVQQQQQSSGVAAAGTQADMAGAAEVTLERNLQSSQAPAQHCMSASAQQAAWQQLPASTVKYAWVEGAQQHGSPAAGRDAVQDFSCGPGAMRPCAFVTNTACVYSWVPAPAVAAAARTLGQAGAPVSTTAAAGQVSDSRPQHSPAAAGTVSEHHLAVPPADQTLAGLTRALAGGSNAAAGTALQQAADMLLQAQHQAADTMDVDADSQRSHHSAAPDPPQSAPADAAAASDLAPAAGMCVDAQSQDTHDSTAPAPSGSAVAVAAACEDAAPAAAAGAAPAWPLPVPEDGPLVFDWEVHKHQLPGLAAAAPEPNKQKVVPVHILQHQPGQQQPMSHHLLALGLLTKTDFR